MGEAIQVEQSSTVHLSCAQVVLLLSDIHSNLSALEAVLKDAEKYGPYSAKLFAGDAGGYGPDAVEVPKVLMDEGFICIQGNHDRAILDGNTQGFRQEAKDAARFNRKLILKNKYAMDFFSKLSNLPFIDPQGRFEMVHGSFAGVDKIQDPLSDELYEDVYVLGEYDVLRAMRAMRQNIPIGIVGHTHVPMYANYWINTSKQLTPMQKPTIGTRNIQFKSPLDEIVNVEIGKRPRAPKGYKGENPWVNKTLINPGSVGQPRDGDPRAAYAILRYDDSGNLSVEYRRVQYDIAETQKRMTDIGLSKEHGGFDPMLIKRLAIGR